jgi:hypothetical protein
LRSILHLEKNEPRALPVVVGKINGLRLQICQNGLDGCAELSGLRRRVPDSTGMLTFSKNRMIHLLTVWFLGFTQRHLSSDCRRSGSLSGC